MGFVRSGASKPLGRSTGMGRGRLLFRVLTGLAFVLAMTAIDDAVAGAGLSIEPARARPAQSVRVVGIEAVSQPLDLVGHFEGLDGSDGEPFPLLTQRTRAGELVFLVPLPPSTDESVTLVVEAVDAEPRHEPMRLEVMPLEPAPGATLRLTELAGETLAIEAERAGADPAALDDRLQEAPETIPVHLLPTALARVMTSFMTEHLGRVMNGASSGDAALDPVELDALIASWGFVDMLRERRDWARSRPRAPLLAPGDEGTPGQAVSGPAGWLDRFVTPVYATTVTKPWQRLDIDTASELHFWMQRRLEYIGRTPPQSKERKRLSEEIRTDLAKTTKDTAQQFAEGYFKEDKARIIKSLDESTGKLLFDDAGKYARYKGAFKFYGKVLGAATLAKAVIDVTIKYNDRMRIALLPSQLTALHLRLQPAVFTEEDDIRGEPGHESFGTIDAQLDARSERFELSLSDVVEIATLGFDAVDKTRGAGESGKTFAKDVHELLSRIADKVDVVREQARTRRNAGLSGAGVVYEKGHFEWRVTQVEDPEYSILNLVPSNRPAVAVFAFPSPTNPVRWGYRPLSAGRSTLRLRTAANRFPGSAPVGTDAAVTVRAIDAMVRPEDPDMRPGETKTFQCPLQWVDKAYRDWRAGEGVVSDRCLYGTCPTAQWTAPDLGPDECRRKVVLACEAMTTQGIRADRDPPRVGTSTIRVRRPGPLSISPEAARVAPGEVVELEAHDSEEPVEWRLVEGEGALERTGPYTARFAAEEPTRATVEAFLPGEADGCRPTVVIRVSDCKPTLEEELKYHSANGDFEGRLLGGQGKTFKRGHVANFAKIHRGGGQVTTIAIHTRRNDDWSYVFSMPLKGQPLTSGAVYRMQNSGETWPVKPGVEVLAMDEYPETPTLDRMFFGSKFTDLRGGRRDEAASGTATVRIDQIEWEDVRAGNKPRGWACGTMAASYVASAWPDDEPMAAFNVAYTVEVEFVASVETRGQSVGTLEPDRDADRGSDDDRKKSEFDRATDRLSDELGL